MNTTTIEKKSPSPPPTRPELFPNQRYPVALLARLYRVDGNSETGTLMRFTRDARDGRLRVYNRGFDGGPRSHFVVLGADFMQYVDEHQVNIQPTDEMLRRLRYRQRMSAGQASKSATPMTLNETILQALTDYSAVCAEDRTAEYSRLIIGLVRGTLDPVDAAPELGELVAALELDESRVEADLLMVEASIRLQTEYLSTDHEFSRLRPASELRQQAMNRPSFFDESDPPFLRELDEIVSCP